MDKQIALDVISNLPDDISMEDIVEALYLRVKIGKRINNYDKSKTISQEELEKKILEWKKNRN